MKRTLFLALTLCAVGSATAAITQEHGTYGFNSLVGEEVMTKDTTLSYAAVLNVGTYAGAGHLTLEENVTLTLPNALLIGGKGYSMPVTHANNGTVVVKPGAVIEVGDKATSSGGHHVDIGNSGYACEGLLSVEGGTVNAGQMLIGQTAGTGTVVVKDGGSVNLSWAGITPLPNPANDQIGLTMGNDGGMGHLILDNGTFTDTTGTNAFLGAAGDASVELRNGSTFTSNSAVWMGDIWAGAYGTGTGTDTLAISAHSSFTCSLLCADAGAAITNDGQLDAGEGMYLYGVDVSNSGTLSGDEILIYSGASVDNTGLLDSEYIELGSGAKLITGNLVVSGCETAMNPDHSMEMEYSTGLAAEELILRRVDGTTVGAHVNGGETMQYLYAQDFRDIDAKVLASLNLQGATAADADGNIIDWRPLTPEEAAQVKVANVIGKNITANVTTDEAHDGGDITVALSGSHLVVRVGDNGATEPTDEDKKASAEKVGTLGSYHEDVTETDASVRLHTTATQSTVEWEGHYMETVTGETSVVNDTTRISVGSDGVEGTLTVVEKSTLQNHGDVASDKVVVNGTLDNNGTVSAATTVNGTLKGSGVMAATTLAETATLIVGNSPGYSTFTDALVAQSGSTVVFSVSGVETPSSLTAGTGWDSHTYSQIVMENGAAVTLCDGVNITIAIGGDLLCSAMTPLHEESLTPFELILIKGGVTSASADLVSLMNHTSFVLTDESGALPLVLTGQTWVIDVANAVYHVNEGNLILSGDLKVTRTPEPATATLSLLALAALASRRRRK